MNKIILVKSSDNDNIFIIKMDDENIDNAYLLVAKNNDEEIELEPVFSGCDINGKTIKNYKDMAKYILYYLDKNLDEDSYIISYRLPKKQIIEINEMIQHSMDTDMSITDLNEIFPDIKDNNIIDVLSANGYDYDKDYSDLYLAYILGLFIDDNIN